MLHGPAWPDHHSTFLTSTHGPLARERQPTPSSSAINEDAVQSNPCTRSSPFLNPLAGCLSALSSPRVTYAVVRQRHICDKEMPYRRSIHANRLQPLRHSPCFQCTKLHAVASGQHGTKPDSTTLGRPPPSPLPATHQAGGRPPSHATIYVSQGDIPGHTQKHGSRC